MFGLGWSEIAVIAALMLVLVKPQEYPNFLRGCVRFYKAITRYVASVRATISSLADELEAEEELERQRRIREEAALKAPPPASPAPKRQPRP